MISESKISKISVCFSIIGLVALFVSEQAVQNTTISQALLLDENSLVEITGIVIDANFFAKKTVLLLSDGNKIKAVFSKPATEQKQAIQKGKTLKVRGKIIEKHGQKLLEVREVKGID